MSSNTAQFGPEAAQVIGMNVTMATSSSRRPIVSKVDPGEPLFHASPSSLVFSEYEGYCQSTATIALRNKDAVARRVRLEIMASPDTEYFTLSAPRVRGTYADPVSPEAAQIGETTSASKIAPGMECVYTLTFQPHQRRCYAIDLLCITERETFCIPVRAAGIVAKIDIPASLSFGEVPVNHPTVRPFLLSNTGTIATRFSLSATPGFMLQPSDGLLPVGQVVQILCTLHPTSLGDAVGTVACMLEDNAVVTSSVTGHAVNVDVGFASSVLKVPPTYINLASHAAMRLMNNSDIPVKFSFKQHASATAERASRAATLQSLHTDEAAELRQLDLLKPIVVDAVKSLVLSERSQRSVSGLQRGLRPRRNHAPAYVAPTGGLDDSMQLGEDVSASINAVSSLANDDGDSSTDDASVLDTAQQDGRMSGFSLESADGTDSDGDLTDAAADLFLSEDVLMSYDEYVEHVRQEQEVRRRYAQLRDNVESSGAFAHPAFTLDPPEGEIYPHGSLDIGVRFKPTQSLEYTSIAYCEVSGVEQRLPLKLVAQGVGPKAVFSFESLDIGDVFIHAVYNYRVTLRNIGDIVTHYSLVQDPASRLKFSPNSGTLAVPTARSSRNRLLGVSDGYTEAETTPASALTPSSSQSKLTSDSTKIDIAFTAHKIGEFVEHIQWRLHGTSEPVVLTFKGRVVGPTFHLDLPALDFGTVCYGFLNSRVVTLYNTSQVPLKYRLRIPQDIAHDDGSREFAITPATAVVLPKSKQHITVSLVSRSVGLYHAPATTTVTGPMTLSALRAANAAAGITVLQTAGLDGASDPLGLAGGVHASVVPTMRASEAMIGSEAYRLVVDILGVGDAVQSVPIKGQGMVFYPTVLVDKLDLGNCYMRLPTTIALPLRNEHDLDAKIEVVPQDEASRHAAELTPEFPSLAIQPNSSAELALTVKCQRLGPFSFPVYLRIPGSDVPPVHVLVTGNGIGPSVVANKSSLNFGSVEVLTPVTQTLTLTNTAPIPAHFKAIFQKPSSVYSVDSPMGTIPPKSTLTLTVTATLNENLTMPDTLIVLIDENAELSIQLRAKGVGTTMEPDTEIERIDHGSVFTHTSTTRAFRLVNRGRRPQTLYWMKIPTHDELDEAEQAMLLATGAATKKDLAARVATEKEANARAMVSAIEADAAGSQLDDVRPEHPFPDAPDAGAETDPETETEDTGGDLTATMRARQEMRKERRLHRPPGHGSKLAMDKASFKRLKALADYIPSTFKVSPAKITLLPDMAMDFTVTGLAQKPGAVKEMWLCRALVGKNKDMEDIHRCRIKCNFVQPEVDFGVEGLEFVAQMNPGEQDAVYPLPTALTLTNPTPLPLLMTLHAPYPFLTDAVSLNLCPGASERVVVSFDHTHKSDRQSAVVQAFLTATFAGHPVSVKLPLIGRFCFPNVSFDRDIVDFGCILNDTDKRTLMAVTNTSDIPVHYEWALLEEPTPSMSTVTDDPCSLTGPASPRGASARPFSALPARPEILDAASATDAEPSFGVVSFVNGVQTALSATDVFSIAPLRGVIEPGQSHQVEFTFFGQQNVRAKSIAICRVLGGPEYELGLIAESSQVSFKLDRPAVHFGARDIDTVSHSEFVLHNPGRVPLDFTIDTSTLSDLAAPCFVLFPLSGQLKAGDRVKIAVAFKSLLPMDVREHVTVQLGFFEPIVVPLTALGTFPHFFADLPRLSSDSFSAALPEAEQLVKARVAAKQAREAEVAARMQALSDHIAQVNGYNAADVSVAPLHLRIGGERPLTGRPGTALSQVSRVGSVTSRGLPVIHTDRGLTTAVGVPIASMLTVPAEYGVADLPDTCFAVNAAVLEHIEADRLSFLQYMKTHLSAPLDKSAPAEIKLPAVVTSAALAAKSHHGNNTTIAQKFAVASYVLDFSHLVLGMSKTRTFTITNSSPSPISWDVSKDLTQRTIFTMEPMSVVRLPPGESQLITVTCAASNQPKKGSTVESLLRAEELVVPLMLRGGPRVNIALRANITVPNLALSSRALDFGSVYIGFRKEITVQLMNDRAVPCEWSARQLAGLTHKERLLFEVSPLSGVLQPGARQNVTVAFTPEVEEKYAAQVPIRMADNPNMTSIKIKAEGVPMELSVSPLSQTLPAVQPFQSSAPVPITVSNLSNFPVEVYSVETDQAYLEEERILAQDDGYINNVLRICPPRIPGDQLPLAVLQRFHAKLRASTASAKLNRDRELMVQNAITAATLNASATNTVLTQERLTEIADAACDDLPDKATTPDAPVNVVVIGSPFSGQTTLAKALAAESALNMPQNVVGFDAAVAFFFKLDMQVEARTKTAEARERERQKRQQSNAKKGSRSGAGAIQTSTVPGTAVPQSARRNSQASDDGAHPSQERVSKTDKAHMAEELRWQEEDTADAVFYASLTPDDLAMASEIRSAISSFRLAEQEAIDAASGGTSRRGNANGKRSVSASAAGPSSASLTTEDSEEDSIADFSDLCGKSVLSEEQLSRVFRLYLLHKGGAMFQRGIIIDGVESMFADRLCIARAVKSALAGTALLRENATHVVALAINHEEARRRALNIFYECKNIVEDKELLNQLKRFKELPEREVQKLPDDKREKYEDMLVLANQRRKADISIKRLAQVDYDRLKKYYGDALGDIEDIRSPVADGSAPPGVVPPAASPNVSTQRKALKPAPPSASGPPTTGSSGSPGLSSASPRRLRGQSASPEAAALPENTFQIPAMDIAAFAAEPPMSANQTVLSILTIFGASHDQALPEPLSSRVSSASSAHSPTSDTIAAAAAAAAAEAAAKEDAAKSRRVSRMSRGRVSTDAAILSRASKSGADAEVLPEIMPALPEMDATDLAPPTPRDWAAQDTLIEVVRHSWIRACWFDGSCPASELCHRVIAFVRVGFAVNDDHSDDSSYIPPPRLVQLVQRPAQRPARAFEAANFCFVHPLPVISESIASEAAVEQTPQADAPARVEPSVAAATPAAMAAKPQVVLPRARVVRESSTNKSSGDSASGEEKEPEPITLEQLFPGIVVPGSVTTSVSVPRSQLLGRSRWVVPARSTHILHVQFTAPSAGEFSQRFAFEQCYRAGFPVAVDLIGTCAVPSISRDPKKVFDLSRVSKASSSRPPQVVGVPLSAIDSSFLDTLPMAGAQNSAASSANSATNVLVSAAATTTVSVTAPAAPPVKQFIMADNVFDFGSLLIGKHHSILVVDADLSQAVEENERLGLRERDEQAMSNAALALATQYAQAYYAIAGTGPQVASSSGNRASLRSSLGSGIGAPQTKATSAASSALGSPAQAKGKRVGGRNAQVDPLLAAGSVAIASVVPPGFGPAESAIVLSQVVAQAILASAALPTGPAVGNANAQQAALVAFSHKMAIVALQHVSQLPLTYSDPFGFRLPNHYPMALGKAFGAMLRDIAAPKLAVNPKAQRRSMISRAPPGQVAKVSPRTAALAASQQGVATANATVSGDVKASTAALAPTTSPTATPQHWTVRRSNGVRSLNSEVFRISNSSPFPLIVRCGFRYRVNSLGQRNVSMSLLAQDALESTRGPGGSRASLGPKKFGSSVGMLKGSVNGRVTTPTTSLSQYVVAPSLSAAPGSLLKTGLAAAQSPMSAALGAFAMSGADNSEFVCYAIKRMAPRMKLSSIDVSTKAASVIRPASSQGDSTGTGQTITAGTSPLVSARNRAERERQAREQRDRDDKTSQGRRADRQQDEEARIEAWKTEDVFTCEPGLITVPVGGVEEITVWSFPQATGVFYDELVCTVADNPEAFVFPVRCEGVEPRLNVSTNDVNFEGLLIGQAAALTVNLHNPTSIPVGWSLRQWELMLATHAFSIQPATSGIIAPGATSHVTIELKAFEEVSYDFRLELDVRDAERVRAVIDTHVIGVRGYCYKLNAVLGMAPNGLDFRTVRTGDEATQHLSVTNQGKFPIKYFIAAAPQPSGQPSVLDTVLMASPAQGILPVGQSAIVALTARSLKELSLINIQNLTVLIQDGCLPAPEGADPSVVYPTPDNVSPSGLALSSVAPPVTMPVPISLKVVHSKLRVLPSSGLTFGPTEVNTARVSKFKVMNDGVFPFQLHIFPQDPAHIYSRASLAVRALTEQQSADAARADSLAASSSGQTGRRTAASGAQAVAADAKRSALSFAVPAASSNTAVATRDTLAKQGKQARGAPARRGAGQEKGVAGDLTQVPDSLTVGMYTISPTCGIVEPGTPFEVSVTLKSPDCGSYIDLLDLVIIDHQAATAGAAIPSGASTTAAASSAAAAAAAASLASSTAIASALPAQSTILKYELCGETCSQGIECRAFPTIFEETEIIAHGQDLQAYAHSDSGEARDLFVLDQKALVFAPVVVGQVPASSVDSSSAELDAGGFMDAAADGVLTRVSTPSGVQSSLVQQDKAGVAAAAGSTSTPSATTPAVGARRMTASSSRGRGSLVNKDKNAIAAALAAGTGADKSEKESSPSFVAASVKIAAVQKPFVWASRTQRIKIINPFKVPCSVSVRTWQPSQWLAYQQQQQIVSVHAAQLAAQEKAATEAGAVPPATPGKDSARIPAPTAPAAPTVSAATGKPAGATATPAADRRGAAAAPKRGIPSAKELGSSGSASALLSQAQAAISALATQAAAASIGDAPGANPFTVSATALVVPPHEHRYVDVSFTPLAFDSYSCMFEAVVEKGSDPQARQLVFELRGDGTLPNLTVVAPTVREPETAAPLLVFPRVFTGPVSESLSAPRRVQSSADMQRLPVVVRNDGAVAASVRFEIYGVSAAAASSVLDVPTQPSAGRSAASAAAAQSIALPVNEHVAPALLLSPCSPLMPPAASRSAFWFDGLGSTFKIAPGDTREFSAAFLPSKPGLHICELRMVVADNQFEAPRMFLRGEGYAEDVSVHGLSTVRLEQKAKTSGDGKSASDIAAVAPNGRAVGSDATSRGSTASSSSRTKAVAGAGATAAAAAAAQTVSQLAKDLRAMLGESAEVREELMFGDVHIGDSVSKTFTLRNHSEHVYRYKWNALPALDDTATGSNGEEGTGSATGRSSTVLASAALAGALNSSAAAAASPAAPTALAGGSRRRGANAAADAAAKEFSSTAVSSTAIVASDWVISPSVGHLPAFGSKTITVTFVGTERRTFPSQANLSLKCALQRITYVPPAVIAERAAAVAVASASVAASASPAAALSARRAQRVGSAAPSGVPKAVSGTPAASAAAVASPPAYEHVPQWWESYYDAGAAIEWDSAMTASRVVPYEAFVAATEARADPAPQTASRKLGSPSPAVAGVSAAPVNLVFASLRISPQAVAQGVPDAQRRVVIVEPLVEPLFDVVLDSTPGSSAAEAPAVASSSSTSRKSVANSANGSLGLLTGAGSSVPQPAVTGSRRVAAAAAPPAGPQPLPEIRVSVPVSVMCDTPRYELDAPIAGRVSFADTLMYQSRTWSFTLRNLSAVALLYDWRATPVAHDAPRPTPLRPQSAHQARVLSEAFTITPSAGSVPADDSQLFTVTFAPLDSEAFATLLEANIVGLSDSAAINSVFELPSITQSSRERAQLASEAATSASFQAPPRFVVSGIALRPKCHFDLVSSDYLSAHRRPPALVASGAPLDPLTRVLEFSSLGTHAKTTRRFCVINPTDRAYAFTWMCEDALLGTPLPLQSPFACAFGSGVVQSGRKFEMVFDYTPVEDVLSESLWRFAVPELGLSVPVLLVGTVKDPRVRLDKSRLDFKSIILNRTAMETVYVVNQESTPFNFSVDKASLAAFAAAASAYSVAGGKTAAQPTVSVEPMQGTVPANGRLPLTVRFRPSVEASHNLTIAVNVTRKSSALTINVKGHGLAIKTALLLRDPSISAPGSLSSPTGDSGTATGAVIAELSPWSLAPAAGSAAVSSRPAVPGSEGMNVIDLGTVTVNDKARRVFELRNMGSVALDFVWSFVSEAPVVASTTALAGSATGTAAQSRSALIAQLNKEATKAAVGAAAIKCDSSLCPVPSVTLSPMTGTLKRGGSVVCEVCFSSDRPVTVSKLLANLVVAKTVRYAVEINARAEKTRLKMSFASFDFGTHFISPPMAVNAAQSSAFTSTAAALPYLESARNATQLMLTNAETDKNVQIEALVDALFKTQATVQGPRTAMGIQMQTLTLPDQVFHLDDGFSSAILVPGESRTVRVAFRPLRAGKFSVTLPLEVNGLYKVPVTLTGEAVPLRLEAQLTPELLASIDMNAAVDTASVAQSWVSFGQLRPGDSKTMTIPVVNKSKKAVTFRLHSRSRGAQSQLLDQAFSLKSTPMPAAAVLTAHKTFSRPPVEYTQSTVVTLEPKGTLNVLATLMPHSRLPPFVRDVFFEVVEGDSLTETSAEPRLFYLFSAKGACVDTGLALDTDRLAFGPVVVGATRTLRAQVSNVGDVACRFAFDTTTLGSNFTVSPPDGIVAPQQTVPIDVIFVPKSVRTESAAVMEPFDITVPRLVLLKDGVAQDSALRLTGTVVDVSPAALAKLAVTNASAAAAAAAAPTGRPSSTGGGFAQQFSLTGASGVLSGSMTSPLLAAAAAAATSSAAPAASLPPGVVLSTLSFTTRARVPVTQMVTITNDSPQPLIPSFSSPLFSGPPRIHVGPKETIQYPITYLPLARTATLTEIADRNAAAEAAAAASAAAAVTSADVEPTAAGRKPIRGQKQVSGKTLLMAQSAALTSSSIGAAGAAVASLSETGNLVSRPVAHEASLFIPLPQGGALCYALVGSAPQPAPVAAVTSLSIPCKQAVQHAFSVTNWLGEYQSFKVLIDVGVPRGTIPSVSTLGTAAAPGVASERSARGAAGKTGRDRDRGGAAVQGGTALTAAASAVAAAVDGANLCAACGSDAPTQCGCPPSVSGQVIVAPPSAVTASVVPALHSAEPSAFVGFDMMRAPRRAALAEGGGWAYASSVDGLFTAYGAATIDVPPHLERQYKLNLFGLIPSAGPGAPAARVRVRFLNERTQEYADYVFLVSPSMTTAVGTPGSATQSLISGPPATWTAPELPVLAVDVRQSKTLRLAFVNPLQDRPVTLTKLSCANPAVFAAAPANIGASVFPLTVPPNGTATVPVCFRPLMPIAPSGSARVLLTISSDILGDFVYTLPLQCPKNGDKDLDLSAWNVGATGVVPPEMLARADSMLRFDAALGESASKTYVFRSPSTVATTYDLSILPVCSGKVTAEASEAAAAFTAYDPAFPSVALTKISVPAAEVSLNGTPLSVSMPVSVRFEPSAVGDATAILILSSAQGGVFMCALTATGAPPKPQGPISLTPVAAQGQQTLQQLALPPFVSAFTAIKFKNVFTSPHTFTFALDCTGSQFVLNKRAEKLGSKSESTIAIGLVGALSAPGSLDAPASKVDPASLPNAKLTVTCMETQHVWTFFVQVPRV